MLLLTTAHAVATAVAAANPADPPAVPIPGLTDDLTTVIGWGKWLAYFVGFIGLIVCGVQMEIGRRNRHSFAADGAQGIPWVLAGATVIAIAGGVIGTFIQP